MSEPFKSNEQAECALCGDLIYNSAAAWKGHFRISHPSEAASPPALCDRIVNNGMGEPTECGRSLPCEYHDMAAPPPALDVDLLRQAMQSRPNDDLDPIYRPPTVEEIAVEYARLSEAQKTRDE